MIERQILFLIQLILRKTLCTPMIAIQDNFIFPAEPILCHFCCHPSQQQRYKIHQYLSSLSFSNYLQSQISYLNCYSLFCLHSIIPFSPLPIKQIIVSNHLNLSQITISGLLLCHILLTALTNTLVLHQISNAIFLPVAAEMRILQDPTYHWMMSAKYNVGRGTPVIYVIRASYVQYHCQYLKTCACLEIHSLQLDHHFSILKYLMTS